jgi:hypothetical protein
MLRNSVSKRNLSLISLGLLLALAILSLAVKPKTALADEEGKRHGDLHLTKECSQYTGLAGSFCTFTSSNIPEIKFGSKVYYDQAPVDLAAPEAGYVSLDSNTVLVAGPGDWAVGRCTLDNTGNFGLCTFSDGTGLFTGFKARVKVSSQDGLHYSWDGTYSFGPAS